MLVQDATGLYPSVRLDGLPNGQFPIRALVADFPGFGKRISRISLGFHPGSPDARQPLGKFFVESATAVIVDAKCIKENWQVDGNERIGSIAHPEHRKCAELLKREFGLNSRPVNFVKSTFEEPVSVELESGIRKYLSRCPEYGPNDLVITTGGTYDRIAYAVTDRLWSEVVLDPKDPRISSLFNRELVMVNTWWKACIWPIE